MEARESESGESRRGEQPPIPWRWGYGITRGEVPAIGRCNAVTRECPEPAGTNHTVSRLKLKTEYHTIRCTLLSYTIELEGRVILVLFKAHRMSIGIAGRGLLVYRVAQFAVKTFQLVSHSTN